MTEFGDWIKDANVEPGGPKLAWFTALSWERQADALAEAFNLAAQQHDALRELANEAGWMYCDDECGDVPCLALRAAEEFMEKYS